MPTATATASSQAATAPATQTEGVTHQAGAGPSDSANEGAARTRGLDEEVAGLVGGFTSFWGRVKKQVRYSRS